MCRAPPAPASSLALRAAPGYRRLLPRAASMPAARSACRNGGSRDAGGATAARMWQPSTGRLLHQDLHADRQPTLADPQRLGVHERNVDDRSVPRRPGSAPGRAIAFASGPARGTRSEWRRRDRVVGAVRRRGAIGFARQRYEGLESRATPNGLPSESRQIAHRDPEWITLPPSALTWPSAASMSAIVK
jgi:hypothetical protein